MIETKREREGFGEIRGGARQTEQTNRQTDGDRTEPRQAERKIEIEKVRRGNKTDMAGGEWCCYTHTPNKGPTYFK